jgi:hypothetical protein
MLTAKELSREPVKRLAETAASQRLVVRAIQGKPKVMASSISRKDTEMKQAKFIALRDAIEKLFFFALVAVTLFGVGATIALAKDRPAYFLPEERRIIENYYRSGGPSKGLPPGLAKRGGKLPPGLQKHIEKNGTLPPGLQKRLEPLPKDLEARLPRLPASWERVILDRDVILVDQRSNRILDILENVIGLATGEEWRDTRENSGWLEGTWYLNGERDKPCRIVSTASGLEARNERGAASLLVYDRYGSIRARDWEGGLRGQVRRDRIEWANGTTWTRVASRR